MELILLTINIFFILLQQYKLTYMAYNLTVGLMTT